MPARPHTKHLWIPLAIILALALLAGGGPAQASCVVDPMAGTWHNRDDRTRSIVRIEYIQECHDVILCPNGRCEPAPRHLALLRVFARCRSGECAWGEAKVYAHPDGDWYYAIYDQGRATHTVWLRLQPGGGLTVVDEVEYRNDRPARRHWNRMHKQ